MGDGDVQTQLNDLRNDVGNVKLQISKMEAEVRVTKHDVANIQMGLTGFSARFDKFQDTMGSKMDALAEKMSALNIKQEKGVSFFAGMAAVISVSAGFIIMLVKMVFGAKL